MKNAVSPTSLKIIENLLEAAEHNDTLISQLATDPAALTQMAGYPIDITEFAAFNAFARDHLQPVLAQLKAGRSLAEVDGIGCTVCKIGVWSLAAALVAAGAAALAYLAPSAGVVISLASVLGITRENALEKVKTLAPVIVEGVNAVATTICGWMGQCDESRA